MFGDVLSIYIPCCHLPCLILCQCRQTNLCNVVQNSDSNIFIVFALQKSRSVLWTELVIRKMFIIGTLESCYNLFKLQQKSFWNWKSTRNGLIFNYLVPCRRWYFLYCDLWVWLISFCVSDMTSREKEYDMKQILLLRSTVQRPLAFKYDD